MDLVRRDVIRPDFADFPGDEAYRFRHALIRDAAYRSLSKSTSADLHERFAGWLERAAGERLREFEEIVGYHLEQAYRCRAAIGSIDTHTATLATRSAQRLESAGRRALARSDLPAAIGLLERAADLLALDAPRRAALLPELGAALIEAGRWTMQSPSLRRRDSSPLRPRTIAPTRMRWSSSSSCSSCGSTKGQPRRERAWSRPSFPSSRPFGDEHGLCRARRLQALLHWNMARAAAAADAWDKAAEHARRAGDEDERNEILYWVASSMFFGPTPVPEGIRRCEEIRAEVVGNPGSEAWALRSLAGLHAMVGRFELARKLLAEANEIFEELGQTLYSSVLDLDGIVELLAGDLDAAERRLSSRIPRAREDGRQGVPPDHGRVSRRGALRAGAGRGRRPLTEISEELAARDDLLTQVIWRRVRAKVIGRAGSLRRGREPRAGGGDDQRVDRLPQHPRRRSRRSRPRSISERAAWTRHAQLSRRASLSTRRRATAWPSSRRRAHLAVLQQT